MGLPVIVSNYGGLPENITPHEDGWIVPPRDIPALQDCLTHILAADLPNMANQARKKAESQFTQHQFASETVTLYQACLRASNKRIRTPHQG